MASTVESGVEPARTLSTAMPDRVVASERGDRLIVTFEDGATREIAAGALRLACRCAHCVRARLDGRFAETSDAITIEAIKLVGFYGVNIAFSDGHARGIYPWHYIADIVAA